MQYVSTRGAAPALAFDEVLLGGLASDGGLYVPETWPRFSDADLKGFRGLAYHEVAARIIAPFLEGSRLAPDLPRLAAEAYRDFGHAAVAPLVELGPEDWLLELFHGPTLAFKDYALQLVGRLFETLLARRGERVTIVGATSGDTGSAAIEACRDKRSIEIFILHPKGRISEVQRRQMTSVDAPNVHNIAIGGTFDDCQDLVKQLFADLNFAQSCRLSAVNSINWARIMAQLVYYFTAGVALGAPERELAFAVPTGNFGNVYAGYAARAIGLPIRQLVVGSNRNDILTRFFAFGYLETQPVEATLSPSINIQTSNNLKRLLFDLYGRDGKALGEAMTSFRQSGRLDPGRARWEGASALFDGYRLDDEATLRAMAGIARESGILVDPHTAIGVAAGRARRRERERPMVALATAHPAKFPDAVSRATGKRPELPDHLADLWSRPERCIDLAKDIGYLKRHILQTLGRGGDA